MMNKREYIDRLIMASDHARELAMSLDYVDVVLSKKYCYSFYRSDDPNGEKDPEEEIKFLGGRHIKRKDLRLVTPARTGEILWVDGFVPEWVNIFAIGYYSNKTEFEIIFAQGLIEAKPEILSPDLGMQPGNNLAPFRVRGPSVSDWQAANKNA